MTFFNPVETLERGHDLTGGIFQDEDQQSGAKERGRNFWGGKRKEDESIRQDQRKGS